MISATIRLSVFAVALAMGGAWAADVPKYAKWATIELTLTGPNSKGRGQPNPFDVRLDVEFTSPDGKRYQVPGFYDGDGKGRLDGDVWRARFSAGDEGTWHYRTSSSHDQLDGKSGRFEVGGTLPGAEGFWKWGRLEAIGTAENGIRYLKFRDGPYWLKAGCDDPENFLGGYRNYGTPAKRWAAVDYLASKGINSLYIMTHNIDGDDKDVWPWLGRAASEAKKNAVPGKVRFDIAKLAAWRGLFEHMQSQGVVPYLILEDDSAWKGYDHDRYYREMIARFGDLPALVFNIGEESTESYRLRDGLGLAKRFKEIDPYDHPLGIHNVNRPDDSYIDSPHIDMTAIQTGSPGSRRGLERAIAHNEIAINWIKSCRKRGRRVLVVNFDEGRPEEDRRAWWSAYMGGGVWEAHVNKPYDRPHAAWDSVWVELGGARAFMESLPFWEMQPHNELVEGGSAFCLAKPGVAYAVYLPAGGEVAVELQKDKKYEATWWKPDQGRDGRFQDRRRVIGGVNKFTPPSDGDWALRIVAAKAD